ncbi:sensor histidine kinase [Denitrificimonas caeni]|uniref:sensor histidine kinase n=1 Tax=Denitrificimonas caeni TaxID=521720 RepID=UPI001965D32A|nr:ATP-binding protein [Denitrificimonas caeni]
MTAPLTTQQSRLNSVDDDAPAVVELQTQLAQFTRLSEQFAGSLQSMQARYVQVQDELAQVSAQRLQELAEKERLAQRLQQILDVLPGAVVIVDGHGLIKEANPAAINLLGVPLLGVLWREVIVQCFVHRADDGHEVSLHNGRRVSIALQALPGEPGQLILLTDMTDTRRLQAELAQHERLSALGKMTAALAHQIRTPLSAAMLYASHLTEKTLNPELQQRFAGRLQERLHELERQVRDMLLFARGPLPREQRSSVAQLWQALQEAAEPHLEIHRLRWQCDVVDSAQVGLLCNQDVLLGALLNLLHNSAQSATQPVAIKVHVYQRQGTLRLVVSDNGDGMDAQLLEHVQESFFSRKSNGTGLGLMVVRAVVQAHQGRFVLRSKVGRGTSALVELPLLADFVEQCEAPVAASAHNSAPVLAGDYL